MKIKNPVNSPSAALLVTLWLWITPALVAAQGLDPAALLKPLADSWPTYSGDYTGRRHSALTQIDQANVKNLTLVWAAKITGGPGAAGGFGPAAARTVIGGEGSGDVAVAGQTTVKGAVLMVNSVLYVTA